MILKLVASKIITFLIFSFTISDECFSQDSIGRGTIKIEKRKKSTFSFQYFGSAGYSREAIAAGIQGMVILQYEVDSQCNIINRTVKDSIGYGLDQSALNMLDEVQIQMMEHYEGECIPSLNLLPVKFGIGK